MSAADDAVVALFHEAARLSYEELAALLFGTATNDVTRSVFERWTATRTRGNDPAATDQAMLAAMWGKVPAGWRADTTIHCLTDGCNAELARVYVDADGHRWIIGATSAPTRLVPDRARPRVRFGTVTLRIAPPDGQDGELVCEAGHLWPLVGAEWARQHPTRT